jgi:uncharacterized membrane protein
MKKKWIFVLAPIALVLFTLIGGEVVMHLWNWLLPALFGWRLITFWQALGLLVLCRILFGSFGGHGHHGPRSRRWERMTPEEREKFRRGLRSRCGDFGAPASRSSEPA